MKIFVSGIGVVSAIGLNVEETLRSLKDGITGIRKSNTYNVMIGDVKQTDDQIIKALNLPKEDYSRTTLLGFLAARQAWGEQKIDPRLRTGMISSTSVGGLDRMEKYYWDSLKNKSVPSDLLIHDNGQTAERIAEAFGISGYIDTISTACSSGANAILQGARLILSNTLDRVIVGGVDALAEFDIKGFSSLNIYDQEICKPFDETRKGLNIGEGAGFLVLENEKSISITGNRPLCNLSGWDNAADAYHQTASSPDGKGASITMLNAIAKAHLTPDKISYINAHGTATGNNDLSESVALKNVFGDTLPAFSSTKGFTGHTLAASGAIEAVFSVLSIRSQAYLPNLNFSVPMKETGLIPETLFVPGSIEHVLSNSFGFGGNCTSLIFTRSGA